MKYSILAIAFLFPLPGFSQEALSMKSVEGRTEISMNDATGKTTEGVYRYYAKGEEKPFTGILYATYPNGNYESWQEFEDGIGQGEWINYYENGEVKEIGHYEQNRVEGPIQKFHSNGQLQAVGEYKDWRVRTGEWKYYDENGILLQTVDYGEKGDISEVEEYYSRGDIPYSWYRDILTKNGF